MTGHVYAEGYQVTSVEASRCGWDLTVIKGNEEIHVEVKGTAGTLVRFFLTANEHKTALSDPNWLLVVVTNVLGEPGWCELVGLTAASYAEPALYQVRVAGERSPIDSNGPGPPGLAPPARIPHASASSWPSIEQHGLQSTMRLLDLFGVTGPKRAALREQPRHESVTLRADGLHPVVIRDQKPMKFIEDQICPCVSGIRSTSLAAG